MPVADNGKPEGKEPERFRRQRSPARPVPDAEAQIAGLIFALILIDAEGRIAQVNQAAETLLGSSATRLVGKPLAQLIGPLDPRIDRHLARGHDALVARDMMISVHEMELQINLTMSPLALHPGWRVITLSPVGHEDPASEQDRSAALSAPAILAHEIKNPLAAIRGAGQLVARKLPENDRKLARMITDEVDRIARLIDRMQQLGAVTSEPPTACNPHEAIRCALATVRVAGVVEGQTNGAKRSMTSVEFHEEFDPSLPPVLANRDALEQVLINLLSNARDAAGAGSGGEVTVRTRFVGGMAFSAIRLGRAVRLPIEITVSDNGPGLDPALRERVFEPFVSSKPSGQGLGLALVRKLVLDMNGSISHERDRQAGLTHFRIHLPVAGREAQAGS